MKALRFLKNHLAVVLLVCFTLSCVLLVGMIHASPGTQRHAYAPRDSFTLRPDSVEEQTIRDYAGVRRSYVFTIPESGVAATGARVMAYLRHSAVRVWIDDGELLYDSGELDTPHIGKTPGNYWVNVPVRPAYAGKTLHVELTPVFESVRGDEPVFYLIGHEDLLNLIIRPQEMLMRALAMAALMIGLFMMLFVLFLPLQSSEKRRVFLLGATVVCAGIWKLTGLASVALRLDYLSWHKEMWYLGATTYMLMLLLSLRFLLGFRKPQEHRVGRLCFGIALVAAAVLLVLQFLNVLELHDALALYGFGVALLHLIAIFEKKPNLPELLWGLLTLVTLGLDLLILVVRGSMHNSPFFLVWSIGYLLALGFGFVRKAILRERQLREQEEELRNAKVASLMQQIRPHFIYNTLTSIYVLCDDDPALAKQVIQDFTAYLQANFTAISATEPIAFSEELQHTKAYVAVESMRYGENLTVEYDVQHTSFRCPPLTLQPLVENAIKHGVGSGVGPEHICVRVVADGADALITVEDDGPGIGATESSNDAHIGLQNVTDRLSLMCGGTLGIRNAFPRGTIVTVRIPRIK